MYGNQTEAFKIKELEMVKEIEKILPMWDLCLQFGTLLGVVREQGLIDSDTDIDICYMSKFNTAKDVEAEMKVIYRLLIDKGVMYNYFTTDIDETKGYWKEILGEELKQPIINPFGQAHVRIGGRDVDFFTSWIDQQGNYCTCQWGCLGKAEDILPFKSVMLYNMEFKVPSNSENILTSLYGEWKIPKGEKCKLMRKPYLKEWLGGKQI